MSTLVLGSRGLVGSAVIRASKRWNLFDFVGLSSEKLDLTDRKAVFKYFQELRPQRLILAAAKVGGIGANSNYPVDFLTKNLQIQTNVLDASHEFDVKRLVFLGSSCIYPRYAPQPIKEESLLTGSLEPTNSPYAIAKIAGIELVRAYRRQYARSWVSLMPTNLYGPGDNFDLETSHVLPALIRKFVEAERYGKENVVLWGTGEPFREFLHVDDLADAIIFSLDCYDDDLPLNVGTGKEIQIIELARLVSEIVGYKGQVEWDCSRPDGVPRKTLDITRLSNLGFQAKISLFDGLVNTIAWYKQREGGVSV